MITQEQRDLRRSGVGGSDIASIMGINPYATALDVYLSKTGQKPEKDETQAIEWGNRLEKVVFDKFCEQHPELEVEYSPDTVKDEWKIANMDGLIIENGREAGVLEIKTASAHSTAWDNGVPEYYVYQVQWYMGVCHLDYAYVACLKGGNEYTEYRIERNDELIDILFDEADAFWSNLRIGVPPDASSPEEATSLHPVGEKESIIEVGDEFNKVVSKLKDISDSKKKLEDEEKRLKAYLMNVMGDAETAKFNDRTVCTWKTSKTTRFNQSAFKEAEPGMFEMFKTEATYRTLRIAKE